MSHQRDAVALLAVAAALTFGRVAAPARAQDTKAQPVELESDVRDKARMFSPEAVEQARAALRLAESRTKLATLIETVESAGDGSARAVAQENARRWGVDGIYVLIDKRDHRLEVEPTPRLRKLVGKDEMEPIRDAILKPFKARKFDEGLEEGARAVVAYLSEATRSGSLARLEASLRNGDRPGAAAADRGGSGAGAGAGPLLLRDQVRMTLAAARRVIDGAEAKAAEMKLKVNVAVVDDGGHLLSFDRMDGARPASAYTAMTKAITAATFRAETGPMPKGASPDLLLNLSLQNAAAASGGKLTTLHGGVPVVVDGQVIGAVGVGGGTGEQDAEVARAGVDRLLSELRAEADGKAKSVRDAKDEFGLTR